MTGPKSSRTGDGSGSERGEKFRECLRPDDRFLAARGAASWRRPGLVPGASRPTSGDRSVDGHLHDVRTHRAHDRARHHHRVTRSGVPRDADGGRDGGWWPSGAIRQSRRRAGSPRGGFGLFLLLGFSPPALARCMSMLPRKCAPSAIATRGAAMSPSTDPLSRMSTFSLAVTLPVTSPRTMTALANTCALILPFGPIVRHVLAELDLAFDLAFDGQVLAAVQLALDDDRFADVHWSFSISCWGSLAGACDRRTWRPAAAVPAGAGAGRRLHRFIPFPHGHSPKSDC